MSSIQDEAPRFRAPPLACDCHFHVFGPRERFPYAGELRYAPPLAPLEDYLAFAEPLGFERFVFVQPSAYGRDNSCMLEAMQSMQGRCRGIVDVDEKIADGELARLHAIGVRGVRINVSPVKAREPGFGASLLPRIDQLEARCEELGWQLDFLLPGWLTEELLERLSRLKVDFTLAHMGMFLAREGVAQPGFGRLLDLLGAGDGHAYVKLTGVYRMSTAPGFADADPIARALIEAAPDRIVWGSDYPHLSYADRVGSVALYNLLARWAPDAAMRRKILVENPQALFGFEGGAS